MSRQANSSPARQPAADPAAVFRRVVPHLAALDVFLRGQVEAFEAEIRTMAGYCLDTSGKRLRPALVFFGGWRGDGIVADELVRAAGVIEMLHLATLVHDDIMDGALIRRGRTTASREFGPEPAVLLGDALFSQALLVASQYPTPEVCRVLSEAMRRICSGEIMQTLRQRDPALTLPEYWHIIDLKTAELFRVSCLLGARLGGYGPEFAEAAARFGRHLGIGYQLYDDLLDFVGEERRIGKTLGTDLATGKLTLPFMVLLEKLPAGERDSLARAVHDGDASALADSRARMRELGVAASIAATIGTELASAAGALAPHTALPPAPLLLELSALLEAQVAALVVPVAG